MYRTIEAFRQTSKTFHPFPFIAIVKNERDGWQRGGGGGEAGWLGKFDGGRQAWEFVIKINYSDRQNGDIRRADGGGRFDEMNRKLDPVHVQPPRAHPSGPPFHGGGCHREIQPLTLCSYLLTTPDLYTIVRQRTFFILSLSLAGRPRWTLISQWFSTAPLHDPRRARAFRASGS